MPIVLSALGKSDAMGVNENATSCALRCNTGPNWWP